jgi:hypothetical protein
MMFCITVYTAERNNPLFSWANEDVDKKVLFGSDARMRSTASLKRTHKLLIIEIMRGLLMFLGRLLASKMVKMENNAYNCWFGCF